MKVLIIDDEERTRDFLKDFVPWDELGIDQVETARNGQNGLEIASDMKPEIVLCDVKMPKMDGISFAQEYRKIAPKAIIIFLSGYLDKEYLKSAIHLKALTYIEKPIVLNEVRQAIEDAMLLCREEERMELEKRRLQEHADRSLPFLRQEMVRKLIQHPQSAHIEQALLSRETFLLPLSGPYTVGAASLHWNASLIPQDPSGVQERMLQEINLLPPEQTGGAIFGFDSQNWLIFILPGDFDGTYRKHKEVIDHLAEELLRLADPNIQMHFGIGETAHTRKELPASYEKALKAGIMQFYREHPSPLFYQPDMQFGLLETDWEEVRQLRDELRRGEMAAVRTRIQQHTRKALLSRDRNTARVKDTYFQILLAILETAALQGITEQTEETERRYIWREIDSISSLSRLESFVLSFLAPLEDPPAHQACMPGKMREIIRYIHSHFHEKGFAIKTIADHVNLSETYLCSYFKKQRAQTLKEFINETRLEKARELLRDRDLKLYEIAVNLGFTDANYFATFFKRYAGCTPSEYRERIAK
ncbi:helix-turn-helix domain-containing protein [Paenibacillus pinistramenti]|uniref:helix-turn-helix domain-containing protein n=1 Tax=Paenibacillus pinistramenti TaxID=1768003 RepID=UPI00110A074E|nr:helix-turn-helix domain-containing protein [Paenibacillus pinistramenti]